MPFAPHEIENKKFVVALRGYATHEVESFLRAPQPPAFVQVLFGLVKVARAARRLGRQKVDFRTLR